MKSSRQSVVIVEDDSVFRRGLVRLFEKENCDVRDFAKAGDALLSIRETAPDFVVCDYKLPGMSGIDLLRELRNENVSTPFVLVTAHFTEELRTEALESGAVAAIPKPLDAEGLREIYQNAVN